MSHNAAGDENSLTEVDLDSTNLKHKQAKSQHSNRPGTNEQISLSSSKTSLSSQGDWHSVTLTWQDINVFSEVEQSKKGCFSRMRHKHSNEHSNQKRILKNVSGAALPGRLLAIMGGSGAGKTTLLSVLTQQGVGKLAVDGNILINGHDIGSGIKNIAAYVQQFDLFLGTLKVKEHLTFQAALRMDKSFSKEQRKARVEHILQNLGLNKCENSIIGVGSRIKGISGGERKRLAFASEILTNPSLLFCDEPTSGLDSFMAHQVMNTLKQICKEGKTVICTIHQPSSAVFEIFDDLCLLAQGRVAYLGPAKQAGEFFKKVGYPCPPNFNPADHYIRTLAMKHGDEKHSKNRIRKICHQFESGSADQSTANKLQQPSTTDYNRYASGYEWDEFFTDTSTRYKSTWCQQFRAIFWRTFKCTIREPMLVHVRAVNTLFIAILMGLLYLQIPLNPSGIQNFNGILFQFVISMVFNYVFTAINLYSEELPVFYREHQARMYRVDTYFLAKGMCELPQYILFPFIFTVILYFMAGLPADAAVFFVAALLNVLIANVVASLGYFIAIAAGDLPLALAIAPIVITPTMLLAGFYINTGSIPVYLKWLQYLSFVKYAYEAHMINFWQTISSIPGCDASNAKCVKNGDEMLQTLNFDKNDFLLDIVILLVFFLAFRLCAFLSLLIRSYRK